MLVTKAEKIIRRLQDWQIVFDFNHKNSMSDFDSLIKIVNEKNKVIFLGERGNGFLIRKEFITTMVEKNLNNNVKLLLVGDSFWRSFRTAKKLYIPFLYLRKETKIKNPIRFLDILLSKLFSASVRGPSSSDVVSLVGPVRAEKYGLVNEERARHLFDSLTRGFIGDWRGKTIFNRKDANGVAVAFDEEKINLLLEDRARGFLKAVGLAGVGSLHNASPVFGQIDFVITGSQINKDAWIEHDQMWRKKMYVVAPGVKDHGLSKQRQPFCLLYSRGSSEQLFDKVVKFLWQKKIGLRVYKDEHFSERRFLRLAKKCDWMFYLGGDYDRLVLANAWMADLPTFVYANGVKNLSEQVGMLVDSEDDLYGQLDVFLQKKDIYKPHQYAVNYCSDKFATSELMDVVKKFN